MQPYEKHCDEYCECDKCSTIQSSNKIEDTNIKIVLRNRRFIVCKRYDTLAITPTLKQFTTATDAIITCILPNIMDDSHDSMVHTHTVLDCGDEKVIAGLSFYIEDSHNYIKELTFKELFDEMLEEVSILKMSILPKLK